MSNASQIVLVSGATGFLGTETALAFLRHGFSVRGTARSQAKGDAWSAKFAQEAGGRMSWAIVEDIAAKGAFKDAIKGVHLVAHTASPFHYDVKDNETDMLIPAITGTNEMLEAAYAEPSVSRVVITSSFASVLSFAELPAIGKTYSHLDWNPATYDDAKHSDHPGYVYCASKKLAEEAGWDFQKAHPDSKFSLTTLCPPLVFGPPNQVISSMKELNTSTEAVWGLIDAPEIPATSFPVFIDVRDIAELHVLAVTQDVAKNQRYLTIASHFDNSEVASLLRRNFPAEAHRIPVGAVTKGPAHFDSDSSKVEKDFNFTWRTLETSVIDTMSALLAIEQRLKA